MRNALAQDLDHVLEHTRPIWEGLRGARLFLTGATGFFGSWLLETFVWANDALKLEASVTALSRDPEAFARKARHLVSHPAISFWQGDMRTFPFPHGNFTHIIHAAADSGQHITATYPIAVFDGIVSGTQRTLEFARQCGARRMLFTSSGAVYGAQPPEMTHMPEGYAGAPAPHDFHSAYGEGKRAAETLCALYAKQHGLEPVIARCFAFVGPYLPLDAHFAAGNFIRDALAGGPIIVRGDGTPYRSYLYAADLAIWLWTLLLRAEPSRPYNVGSEEEVTVATLAERVAEVCGPSVEVRIAQRPEPGKPPARYVPSTVRARTELMLAQHIGLSEAIRRTVAWARPPRR